MAEPALRVQVAPYNPGDVTVVVWRITGGSGVKETFTATTESPLDKTWQQLEPVMCLVTISWKSGYQNIASGGGVGNNIFVYGKALYYQILGTPADANGVQLVIGIDLRPTATD